jgi:hypothetical protein
MSGRSDSTNLERRHFRKGIEVAVVMRYGQGIPECAGPDQAVDARANGQPSSSSRAIEIDSKQMNIL